MRRVSPSREVGTSGPLLLSTLDNARELRGSNNGVRVAQLDESVRTGYSNSHSRAHVAASNATIEHGLTAENRTACHLWMMATPRRHSDALGKPRLRSLKDRVGERVTMA